MGERSLAVSVKLWAVLCAMVGVSLAADALTTCALTAPAFCQLIFQRKRRLALSFGGFIWRLRCFCTGFGPTACAWLCSLNFIC